MSENGSTMEERVWHPSLSKSQREVSYSCGACGFALKLSSSDRKYAKFSRKNVLAFASIDASRFELDEAPAGGRCWSWSDVRSELRCGNCRSQIGWIKDSTGDPTYCVKIARVLPEQDQEINTSSPRDFFSWSEDRSSSFTSSGSS